MDLRIGDILLYLFDIKWEIVGTKASTSSSYENNYIKCCSLMDKSILEFRRRNGLWQMGTSHNNAWHVFDLGNLSIISKKDIEEDSIEHFQKKIEDTKYELNRLENTLKGLQDSKRMKELTETLSNLIVGDFYTVKLDSTFLFTGICLGNLPLERLMFKRIDGNSTSETIYKNDIKQIIHRPNFSNEYRILLKKIDTFNKDLENT